MERYTYETDTEYQARVEQRSLFVWGFAFDLVLVDLVLLAMVF